MRTVTHREMRNNSAEILRAVASGETIQITNNGVLAAIIAPPGPAVLADLVAAGHARAATRPPSSLKDLKRHRSRQPTRELLEDVRGRW
jgi:antitoxin (DNA-binding transcriptional repressor) of toxin-antitoxin stability system